MGCSGGACHPAEGASQGMEGKKGSILEGSEDAGALLPES